VILSSTDKADGGGRVPTAAFPKERHDLPLAKGKARPDSCQALCVIYSTCGLSKAAREGKAPQSQMASLAVVDVHVHLCLLILMLIVFCTVCKRLCV